MAQFDPLTANAVDLQRLLSEGKTSSVQIVEVYLAQIDAYEQYVNAFITVAPRDVILKAAAALDAERVAGATRSPYHGIPIVIKDSIITAPELGMPTTVGSWVFAEARAKGNASLVQKLVDAGLLVLGKTNLTENCGFKTTWIMPGWSAYGGQTLSPYVGHLAKGEKILGHSAPGGSSAGSAVAVAAGFSPLAIGTETIGSIMVPAGRAGLYAIKPTIGSFDMKGIFSLCTIYDSAGPMTKTPADLVPILDIALGRPFAGALQTDWNGVSVGFVPSNAWTLNEGLCEYHEGTAEEMAEKYEAAAAKIREAGGTVKFPVTAPDMSELTVDGEQVMMPISFWDFKNITVPEFIAGFDNCPAKSLADITKFNEDNKEKALPEPFPDQGDLIKAVESNAAEEDISRQKKSLRSKAIQMLDEVFSQEGIDVIAAPADGPLLIFGAATGYPTATVPLGTLSYNGRPYGIALIAKAGNEEALVRFMSAYEATFPPRPVPEMEKLKDRVGKKA